MAQLPISVVVVSWNRPDWLRRCLRAIGQLDYARYETIVVACSDGTEVARAMGIGTVLTVDRANISAARNLGGSAASGDAVAFIDDDAVPEPTWLWHLAKAFEIPNIVQAGGTTLGRNGISVQHAAARVAASGQSHPVAGLDRDISVIDPEGDLYPRLHGTNMIIRRTTLVAHGGFDERFAFYLDETDLSYRISRSGGQTACVPCAVVHHASGPSHYRNHERTPRHVFEIAASAAVFHRKHCPPDQWDAARQAFLAKRRTWIIDHMVRGTLTPDRAHALISELADGYDAGISRRPLPEPAFTAPSIFQSNPRREGCKDIFLTASRKDRSAMRNKARSLVDEGHRVTLFEYRPTARYHRVTFTDEGYWLHTGGIYGRETRTEPVLQQATLAERIEKTRTRLAGIRTKDGRIFRH